MKKRRHLIFLFLYFFIHGFLMPVCLQADNGDYDDDIAWVSYEEEKEPKLPFRVKNRVFEIGFLDIKAGFANNFLTTKDIFSEKMLINIDELEKGFGLNFGVIYHPLFINFNKNDKWGVGFAIGIETAGVASVPGNLLSFSEADNEKPDASGAVFVEARFNGFFHIGKFKIKIKPSVYYPLAYVRSDISYTNRDVSEGTILNFKYNMRVFTAFPLNVSFSENYFSDGSFSLTTFPGVDIITGVVYPMSEAFSLNKIHPALDFDLGLDLINLPTVPAFMKNYMEISGQLGSDEPLDFINNGITGFSMRNEDIVYGEQRTAIFRPFKFVTWIEWRPFKTKSISFVQFLGFMLNPFYHQIFSLEAGLKARLDLLNMFIFEFGIGYYDRLWKNSFDLVINFRAFELDLGVEMRSQNFVKSWAGAGYAVGLAMKFGW